MDDAARFLRTLTPLCRAVELRDPYTAGHNERVGKLARKVGGIMGLAPHDIEGLHAAAALHDVGKVAVPLAVLTKPGRLVAEEVALIRRHPFLGATMLADVDVLWPIKGMIEEHHERMDGSGYPHGLSGRDIHPSSRIIAVADVVDAMSSHRPYHPARPMEQVRSEIVAGRGAHMTPTW